MSDAFQMPKTVELPRSDYAPKRGLAAVAEAVGPFEKTSGDPPPYKAPSADYKPSTPEDAIREALKKLTHRQMRALTAAIFEAAKSFENASGDTIAKSDLPDVLDKFAYGD